MEKQDRKAPAKAKAPARKPTQIHGLTLAQYQPFREEVLRLAKEAIHEGMVVYSASVKHQNSEIKRMSGQITTMQSKLASLPQQVAKPQPAPAPTGLQPGDYTNARKETADALTAMGLETLSRNTYQQGGGRYWWDGYRIANTSSYGQTYRTPSEFLSRAAITAKELGLTPVKEEAWVPKVGEWVTFQDGSTTALVKGVSNHNSTPGYASVYGDGWGLYVHNLRPATPAEITAHLAALEAAKPVGFGTWVDYDGERWRVASDVTSSMGNWMLERNASAAWAKRSEFTVIDPQP